MPLETGKARDAALAVGCAIAAIAAAGAASVEVQLGGLGGYVATAILVVVALALLGAAGYWTRRATRT